MNVCPLTVPLTALFGLTNLCSSSFACLPRFALDAGADLSPLFTGDLGLYLIVPSHGSGFPLTDATSHQLWAVGFPDIFPLDKQIEDTDIAAVEIHVKLAPLEPREQAGADVPTPLKRESVVIRNMIALMRGL